MCSPFPYDKISSGESFFGRDEEMAVLSRSLQYPSNLLIYSKRRIGKSSLASMFFQKKLTSLLKRWRVEPTTDSTAFEYSIKLL